MYAFPFRRCVLKVSVKYDGELDFDMGFGPRMNLGKIAFKMFKNFNRLTEEDFLKNIFD